MAIVVVIRIGFEPMTYRLEICCSIQLSYRTIYWLIKELTSLSQ
jgi:hypothetical protein